MLLLYNLALRFYFILIMIAAFFNKKAKLWLDGRKKIEYELPELKEVLEETLGVIVYQEQVMQIANRLAGYSLKSRTQ